MEHLINLNYIAHITFGDHALFNEMLEEWIKDTELKIDSLKEKIDHNDLTHIDRAIHDLKTNFFIIGSGEASRICENFIHSNCQNEIKFLKDIQNKFAEISTLVKNNFKEN